jgi:oligoribonuclease NrnB/cAMP/cGMP phosphodiesterase (DHH superfamily)
MNDIFYTTVQRAIKAFDSDNYQGVFTNNISASYHLLFARLIDKSIHDSINVSDYQRSKINQLCALIEKNLSVFTAGLIDHHEYTSNTIVLYDKLKKQLIKFLAPKIKNATKLDLYSLRANMQGIDNEN